MANAIVGTTYIIDTASGNTAVPWPGNAKIQSVVFTGGGSFQLSGANTTQVLLALSGGSTQSLYLGGVWFGSDIKFPVVTGGTAWIYFA